ncbi:hypothetical protein DXT99_02745 [Pontibacter diazotrophicus]|uniref:Metal-dependent hydrolase n=1 Tax=Pontibacter diazotrophicus TaxID=1400979 RepID=A0A3D8LHH2_9BACT|nr:hypothetical protein DXT99_02745 [Pontibacter diazotrophicus]
MTPAFILHLFLHVAVPLLVAALFFRKDFRHATLVMLAGILIDIDHVAASPIVDPDRCSVGYHLLHSYWLIPVYVALALYPKTRLIGLGLVIHILLDTAECVRAGNAVLVSFSF